MRFFVIRHGETAWNVAGRFQGQQDTELNEKGLAQAELLGERLAGHRFEAVLTSPLARAKVTAERASARCECGEFLTVGALTEINHGASPTRSRLNGPKSSANGTSPLKR